MAVSATLGSVCVLPPIFHLPGLVCRFAGFFGGGGGGWGGRAIDSVQFLLIEEPSKIRSKTISEKPNRRSMQARLPDGTTSFHLLIESTTNSTKT